MLELNSSKAFRVHRTLALRKDLVPQEIDILLTKRDLDVYHNLCLNFVIPLSREQVLVLTTFAQTPREEQVPESLAVVTLRNNGSLASVRCTATRTTTSCARCL